MPTTMSFCAICGGLRDVADKSVKGRRCTCTDSSIGDKSGEKGGVGVATKICSVCKADVTDKKRMKDSGTGKYWCYDCYLVEQRKKNGSGMTMRCPHCNKDFPPTKMVKHGEAYWCDACQDVFQTKGKKKKTDDASAAVSANTAPGKTKKLVAIAVVVAVGAAAYSYFMGFFGS